MDERYIRPEIEVIEFGTDDVMQASLTEKDPNGIPIIRPVQRGELVNE